MKMKLYSPHPGQRALHDSSARFRIATCGRRWGKTFACVNELAKFSWENPRTNTMWVSPTYRQSRIAHRLVLQHFKGAIESSTKNPMEVVWKNGTLTQFNSTDQADNLRGESCHFMILDECAMIEYEAWTNILRPMLTDTNGRAIMVSTPRGMNWFHAMHLRGYDPEYADYESFTFPTSSNPYIPEEEVEEVKKSIPEDVFKQEYLAEFLEDGGAVFKKVDQCIQGTHEEPQKDKHYIIGFDVAKHHDHSVAVVINNATGHVVQLDRFSRMDYNLQIKRVERLAKKYNNAKIFVDSTGVGDPIYEELKNKTGLPVEGVVFSNKKKQQLIEHLAVRLERKEVTFPNIPVLVNELKAYQYEITPSGNMKYGNPPGGHDDTVIALALAAWGSMNYRIGNIVRL
jgi:hypothetical protein